MHTVSLYTLTMKFYYLAAVNILSFLMISCPLHAHAEFDHSYKNWSSILSKVVVKATPTNLVDYRELKNSPEKLDSFVTTIESVDRSHYESFSRNQKIAFLINAYNALTLKHIITHYPVSSIKNTGGFFHSPWKIEFFSLFGEKRNLDYIEHEILRNDFDEPRIHFAIVCAAKSCPPLQPKPFLPSNLDTELEKATRNFLLNSERNVFDSGEKILKLSKIFFWFEEDFEKEGSSVKSFVASRMSGDEDVQKLIQSEDTDLEYFDYDWSLNEVADNP